MTQRSRFRKIGALMGVDFIDFLKSINNTVSWPTDETSGDVLLASNPAVAEGRNIIINGDFSAWTGDNPDGWTVTEVGDATSNITQNPPGQCQIISDGTSTQILQSNSLAIGATYDVSVEITDATLGAISLADSFGAGKVFSTVAIHTFQAVAISTSFIIKRQVACNVTIDNVTAKQINIAASSSFPGGELLTDGDMEAADTSAWVAQLSTLSKETNSPYQGTQNLKVLNGTGGVANSWAYQNILTAGVRYKVTGWCRGDGINEPTLWRTTALFTGTTSTDWQYIEFEFVSAASLGLFFGSLSMSDGGYVEFDSISVREANPLNADVTGAAITATSGVSFPYTRTYNGTTTYTDIYSAELKSVLDPTDFSFGIFVQKDTWDTTERDFFSLDVDANNYIRCTDTTTAGTIQYEIKAGGISETIPHLTGSPTGWFMIDLTVTGGNLIASFNGAVVGTPQAVAGTFTGNLTSAVIGARTTTPTFVHLGGLSVPYMGMLRSFTQSEKLTIAQKAGVV